MSKDDPLAVLKKLLDVPAKDRFDNPEISSILSRQIERHEVDLARQIGAPYAVPLEEPTSSMADDREYVNLKLEAAEARTEARFAEMNGKLDRLIDSVSASREALREQISMTQAAVSRAEADARSEYRSTRTTIIVTAFATGLALAALMVSVMTYGDAIFSRGMSVRDVVNAITKEQAEKTTKIDGAAPK